MSSQNDIQNNNDNQANQSQEDTDQESSSQPIMSFLKSKIKNKKRRKQKQGTAPLSIQVEQAIIGQQSFVQFILTVYQNHQEWSFGTRYSTLRHYHNKLMKDDTIANLLPSFPPKKVIGNTDRQFVIERMKQINIYFKELVKIESIIQSDLFKKFIEHSKSRAFKFQDSSDLQLFSLDY